MKKDMIVLVVRIILSIVGIACLAACIAQQGENQVLLWIGSVLNIIAFLLSFVSQKDKQ